VNAEEHWSTVFNAQLGYGSVWHLKSSGSDCVNLRKYAGGPNHNSIKQFKLESNFKARKYACLKVSNELLKMVTNLGSKRNL
jgi:hypothetical protein